MIIHKVINNNIVYSLDKNRNEIIVMGRGVAFKKKKGDVISDDLIEKTFYLKNDNESNKFVELLKDIPFEVINVTDEVVEYAKSNLDKELNDGIYITLMDHINYSIERYLQGIYVKNALMWEIQQFYREEFLVASEMLKIINTRLSVQLSDDEVGFITLHLVNAELNGKMEEIEAVTKFIQEVLNIVRYYFKISFEEDSLTYNRFITHLKFFAKRLIEGSKEVKEDDILFKIIIERYPEAFECVNRIEAHVQKMYNKNLSQSEKLYLTMHIARIKY